MTESKKLNFNYDNLWRYLVFCLGAIILGVLLLNVGVMSVKLFSFPFIKNISNQTAQIMLVGIILFIPFWVCSKVLDVFDIEHKSEKFKLDKSSISTICFTIMFAILLYKLFLGFADGKGVEIFIKDIETLGQNDFLKTTMYFIVYLIISIPFLRFIFTYLYINVNPIMSNIFTDKNFLNAMLVKPLIK